MQIPPGMMPPPQMMQMGGGTGNMPQNMASIHGQMANMAQMNGMEMMGQPPNMVQMSQMNGG